MVATIYLAIKEDDPLTPEQLELKNEKLFHLWNKGASLKITLELMREARVVIKEKLRCIVCPRTLKKKRLVNACPPQLKS